MHIIQRLISQVETLVDKERGVFFAELFMDYKYVSGANRCHPAIVELIKRAARTLDEVARVSPPQRGEQTLHSEKLSYGAPLTWKPDVVLWDKADNPLCVVEYESLNSSDERVFEKDISKYERWTKKRREEGLPPVPLLIVTTLPNRPFPQYKNFHAYNREHKGVLKEIRLNPCAYWYAVFRQRIGAEIANLPIAFANFDGHQLGLIPINLALESAKNRERSPKSLTEKELDSEWFVKFAPPLNVVRIRRKYKKLLLVEKDTSVLKRVLREYWEKEQQAWGNDCWNEKARRGFLKDVERVITSEDAARIVVNVQANKY